MAIRVPATERGSKTGLGGGNLEMEQLHAIVDVHLLAPAKTMTAQPSGSTLSSSRPRLSPLPPAKADTAPSHAHGRRTAPEQAKEQGQEQVAAQDQAEKPSNDPPMVGSCDRMWARVALKPKSELDKTSSQEAANTKTASDSWVR